MPDAPRTRSSAPSKWWAVIRREYLTRVRSRWFIISTIFGPLFFAALVLGPAYAARYLSPNAPRGMSHMVILDATNTGLGESVATAFRASNTSRTPLIPRMPRVLRVTSASLDSAEATVMRTTRDGQASGYVVLDSATLTNRSARYWGYATDTPEELERLRHVIAWNTIALELRERGVAASAIDSMFSHPVDLTVTSARGPASSGNPRTLARALLAMIIAFLLYMSIVLYGQTVMRSVTEEKISRVAEIVLSSVRPMTLLAGKVGGIAAVAVTQQLVWIVATIALTLGGTALIPSLGTSAMSSTVTSAAATPHASEAALAALSSLSPGVVLLFLLCFVLGFIFYGSLYAAVGATVSTDQDAQTASQPIILLLVATVVCMQFVIANPDGMLGRVLSVLPFSSPVILPLRLGLTDVPTWETAAGLGLLVASCVGVVWVSAKIYRVGLLMYGKRPSLRELRRWIAAA